MFSLAYYVLQWPFNMFVVHLQSGVEVVVFGATDRISQKVDNVILALFMELMTIKKVLLQCKWISAVVGFS